MTWTDLVFINGVPLPAEDVGNLNGNAAHGRAEADGKYLFTGELIRYATEPNTELVVKLDATTIATFTTSGLKQFADYDISGFIPGLHLLVFVLDGWTQTFRILKTEDMKFLTMWLRLSANDTEIAVREITLIGHRESQGWA